MSRPRLSQALGIGILFGVVEATTPLLGWLLGSAASRFVASIDHWVAFVLLAGLGIHMVWKSFQPLEPECDDQSDAPYDTGVQLGADGSALRTGRLLPAGLLSMLLTSVATSIDAMVVGASLAFLDANIFTTAGAIGLATFVMVTLGVMLGRGLGRLVGRRAERVDAIVAQFVGGVVLVLAHDMTRRRAELVEQAVQEAIELAQAIGDEARAGARVRPLRPAVGDHRTLGERGEEGRATGQGIVRRRCPPQRRDAGVDHASVRTGSLLSSAASALAARVAAARWSRIASVRSARAAIASHERAARSHRSRTLSRLASEALLRS